jgi:staphyloferrin B biosynthesis citrate synthase
MQLTNPVKETITRGGMSFGLNVRLSHSSEIARIAKATGHEFLYIDAQHALFNPESIGHITQTALACGVAPMVRTRGADDPNLSLFLDAGILGLVIPNIETAEQARRVVDATRFAPVGKRSIGGMSAHFNYESVSPAELVSAFDSNTLVICMIESVEGLANLDEIGAVEGVDGLYLGMNDMLISMGKAGQFDDPEIGEALDRIIAVAHANGKFTGCGGVDDVPHQVQILRKGVQFMTTQSDLGLVLNGAGQAMKDIRDALDGVAK